MTGNEAELVGFRYSSKSGEYVITVTGKNKLNCDTKLTILVGHNTSIFNEGEPLRDYCGLILTPKEREDRIYEELKKLTKVETIMVAFNADRKELEEILEKKGKELRGNATSKV